MDYYYNQNKDHGYYDQPTHATGQVMSVVAMVFGFGALATCLTIYLAIFLGCFGILFALLSKGFEKKMLFGAKVGSICSVCGILAAAGIMIVFLVSFLLNPQILVEYGKQYDSLVQQTYGQSAEAIMGYSFEQLANQAIQFIFR